MRRPRTRLTDEDVVALREAYAAGEDTAVIAERYSTSRAYVWQVASGRYRAAAGGPITRRRDRDLAPRQTRELRAAYAAGATARDLADRYGITVGHVTAIGAGRKHRNRPGPTRPRGRGVGPKRYAPEVLDDVRRRRARGQTLSEIAAAHGMSRSYVSMVCREEEAE